ncbi:MAG: type II toxin-antitoxin system HicA family toxin [Defluviitaleaceae bacterium]|nr:type II toxin-antitoxin system HicA family toxin [Defluviitaleaceae bacterium]
MRPGKGDHEVWHSPITNRTVSVDIGTRNRHTANEIMKDAGIKHKF